jgi:hypothetical protein
MDLARPRGVVFDDTLGIQLLRADVAKRFQPEQVYIKGLAEREPLRIHYTKERTQILNSSKQPLDQIRWEEQRDTVTLSSMRTREIFRIPLIKHSSDPAAIRLQFEFQELDTTGKQTGLLTVVHSDSDDFKYVSEAGKSFCKSIILRLFRHSGVKIS